MTILLYVLIVIFILGSISFVGVSIFTENPKFCIGAYVSLVLAIVCVCMLPDNKEPSELYQEKVEAVEKANNELEKFLIDYPEFKGGIK